VIGSLDRLEFLDFTRLRVEEVREIVQAAAALSAGDGSGLRRLHG
jgi:hypothetical protein